MLQHRLRRTALEIDQREQGGPVSVGAEDQLILLPSNAQFKGGGAEGQFQGFLAFLHQFFSPLPHPIRIHDPAKLCLDPGKSCPGLFCPLPEILLKPRQIQTPAAVVDQFLGIRIAGAGFMGLQQADGPQLPVSRLRQIAVCPGQLAVHLWRALPGRDGLQGVYDLLEFIFLIPFLALFQRLHKSFLLISCRSIRPCASQGHDVLHFTMDLNISLSSAVSGNRNGITSRTALRIPLLDGIRLSCHGGLYLSPNIKSKFKISIYYNKRKPGKMQSLSWLSVSVSPGGPRVIISRQGIRV